VRLLQQVRQITLSTAHQGPGLKMLDILAAASERDPIKVEINLFLYLGLKFGIHKAVQESF
jgi:hypothetical protein